jgi:hypothetical protein
VNAPNGNEYEFGREKETARGLVLTPVWQCREAGTTSLQAATLWPKRLPSPCEAIDLDLESMATLKVQPAKSKH